MRKKNKDTVLLLMILPAFIGFMVLFIAPVVMSFGYSFTSWSVYKPTIAFVGLNNYIRLFDDAKTLSAIGHSIKYALIITVVQNVLAILFAVMLTKNTKVTNLVKSVFFLPATLSILVVGFLFQFIMTSADYGLLNNIIHFFGGKSVNWLGNPKIALYSVLSTQVWQWTGWAMVIYIANIKSIDEALYEAANIDGASKVQVFFRVTLPLLYPAASFNILLSLIGGLKVFDIVFAMTKGGPGYATETIMTTLIRVGFSEGKNAYACAFAVVFFIVVLLISRIVMRILGKWEARLR